MYIFQMLESERNESYSYIINETKVSQKIIQSQPSEQFFIYIMASYIDWDDIDDDVCFVLDQHGRWNFYSASSLYYPK